MKIDTLTQKDIDKFKKWGVNKTLVEKFEKNKEVLDRLKTIEDLKLEFFENDKTIDNIEIGKECIDKGLRLTPLNKCNFIIPIEIVNMITKFKDNHDGLARKKPENFLILHPSKYSKFKNKEIPIEDIGVYYNPYSVFYLCNFSAELLEMKNKPKKALAFKQANILLGISTSNVDAFKNNLIASIVGLLIFGFVSSIIFIGGKNIIVSSIILLTYFVILIDVFYKLLIKPLKNKDKIIEEARDINFIYYLNKNL